VATNLACNVGAMDSRQRGRHSELAALLRREGKIERLTDGLAFTFPAEAARALELAEFMSLERLCCPFLRLTLEFAPDGGPLRLSLAGPPGTEEFLRHELALPPAPDLAP
jgi:hypothetical protein